MPCAGSAVALCSCRSGATSFGTTGGFILTPLAFVLKTSSNNSQSPRPRSSSPCVVPRFVVAGFSCPHAFVLLANGAGTEGEEAILWASCSVCKGVGRPRCTLILRSRVGRRCTHQVRQNDFKRVAEHSIWSAHVQQPTTCSKKRSSQEVMRVRQLHNRHVLPPLRHFGFASSGVSALSSSGRRRSRICDSAASSFRIVLPFGGLLPRCVFAEGAGGSTHKTAEKHVERAEAGKRGGEAG